MINKRILKTGALAAAMTVVFAIFAFRAADWTKGLSSEFIVYGQNTNTGGGGSSGPTGPTGATGPTGTLTTRVLPQIAAGNFGPQNYSTVIEVVNPSNSVITLSGNFYDDKGSPAGLTFATNSPAQKTVGSSFTNLIVSPGQILVLSVGASAETMPPTGAAVWGVLTGSGNIVVSSFFETRDVGDNHLYSRVGVESSPTLSSFIIPRVRETVSKTQGQDLDTGFALVNTGTTPATVTAKVIDVNGGVLGSASFPLLPHAHKVVVAGSPTGFSFFGNEAAGRQYQYMLFTSDQPTIAATALGLEGFGLTSFPVIPLN